MQVAVDADALTVAAEVPEAGQQGIDAWGSGDHRGGRVCVPWWERRLPRLEQLQCEADPTPDRLVQRADLEG